MNYKFLIWVELVNLALHSMLATMGMHKNDAMNHARAASAGARISLDRAPISLLTSANARCLIVRQRISHLRERGIIISDAEAKYQRWLAISAGNSPRPDPPSRPSTAVKGSVRPNKASLLRRDHLPKARAEPDYKMIARSRRTYERQCKSASAIVTSMMSKDSESESLHEFLLGARYNCTHQIDSRSLERLGVYVPRANVAGAFINPAGIFPPSKKYRQAQGRASLSHSSDVPAAVADSFSAGLLGMRIKEGSVSDVGSDISTKSSGTNDSVACDKNESQVQQGPGKNAKSKAPGRAMESTTNEDVQMLISEYAQQLTEEILHHSMEQSTNNQYKESDTPLVGLTVEALCGQFPAEQNGGERQTDSDEILTEKLQNRPYACSAGVSASVQTITSKEDYPIKKTEPAESELVGKHEGEMKLTISDGSNTWLEGERSSMDMLGSSDHSLLTSQKSEPDIRKSSSTIFIDLVKLQEDLED